MTYRRDLSIGPLSSQLSTLIAFIPIPDAVLQFTPRSSRKIQRLAGTFNFLLFLEVRLIGNQSCDCYCCNLRKLYLDIHPESVDCLFVDGCIGLSHSFSARFDYDIEKLVEVCKLLMLILKRLVIE